MTQRPEKQAFVVMFEEGHYLKDRVIKICKSFNEQAFEFQIESAPQEFAQLKQAKQDIKELIKGTRNLLIDYLVDTNRGEGIDCSLIMVYKWFLAKERCLYENLNKLKNKDNFLRGLMWCPSSEKENLKSEFSKVSLGSDNPIIQEKEQKEEEKEFLIPPTKFNTNAFIAPF